MLQNLTAEEMSCNTAHRNFSRTLWYLCEEDIVLVIILEKVFRLFSNLGQLSRELRKFITEPQI